MATKVIRFKRKYFTDPYTPLHRKLRREFSIHKGSLMEREAAETRKIARRSMKKAPKAPKSRFGEYRKYSYRSKKYGTSFYRKGLYSRPGTPPFYHGFQFDLRFIVYGRIAGSAVKISMGNTFEARVAAYRVGPKYKPNKFTTPVPQLHEYGGKVRINKRAATFTDRGHIMFRRTGGTGTLDYPARPYMRPAAKLAQQRTEDRLEKIDRFNGIRLKRYRKSGSLAA